jgi:hypothetical protein
VLTYDGMLWEIGFIRISIFIITKGRRKIMKFLRTLWGIKEEATYKVNNVIGKLLVLCTVAMTSLFKPLIAKADELDFLKKADGKGAFSSVNEAIKDTGGSLYVLIRNVGLIVLVIGVAFIGVGIASTKNANKREDNKLHLVWFIIGAVVFFGGFTVIAMAKKISAGITVN